MWIWNSTDVFDSEEGAGGLNEGEKPAMADFYIHSRSN